MHSLSALRAVSAALGASLALLACGGSDSDADGNGLDASTGRAPPDASVGADGLTAVALRFKAEIDGQDLVCGRRYAALGSSKIAGELRDFRFFVHDVRLIDARGAEVPLQLDERPPFQSAELALLDFSDGRGRCTNGAPESNLVIHGRVPAGHYTGLAFTTGVPEALNHADPSSAPAPLQAPGVQWTRRQGYRFVIAELDVGEGMTSHAMDGGVARSDAGTSASSGEGTEPVGVAFAHIGSTRCSGVLGSYRCAQANRSQIALASFDPAKNVVVADLSAVFAHYDLRGAVQCHNGGLECAPAFSAFGIDADSGVPVPGQRVFRSE